VTSESALLQAARTLAADLLAPGARRVDASEVPRSHLDALGRAGLLGLGVPADAGGPGLAAKVQRQIQRVLAGADLATWFVSAQHHGPVRLVADSEAPIRTEVLPRLVTGQTLAGTAFAHLRRWPDRPVRAERTPTGWQFSGHAPWYTGWGLNDVFTLGGATIGGEVVFGLVEARPQPGLTASEPLAMLAMTATRTVRLTLDGLVVPDSHVLLRQPVEEWLHLDRRQAVNPNPGVFGLTDAALALLASRCTESGLAVGMKAAQRLRERLDRTYAAAERLLDDVPPDDAHEERLAIRAEAQRLMIEATTALIVAGGGRSVAASDPAQRHAREAAFLLVQAQTRPAREVMLAHWARD
jgi:alkylation response protein AidB-like acyl-CoA dehydrogenase